MYDSMYDCIIVGGGIAGLQAAVQLGRYERKTIVIDAGYGRSTICKCYHNILGWPDGVSGNELRKLGRMHAEKLGIEFYQDKVTHARQTEDGFVVKAGETGREFAGKTLLLATGIRDRLPSLTGLSECLGQSIYVCPDCDGYEVKNYRTVVLGSGNAGANMALVLTYWTDDIVYINHEQQPIAEEKQQALAERNITILDGPIQKIEQLGGDMQAVMLQNGAKIEAKRAFVAFGGNEVQSGLAEQLNIERMENNHIPTDPRSKMTNIKNVWAAGDLGVHSEQATIAMGEGTQSAIWMHKTLLKMEEEAKRPVTVV